jgi:hypothetical protein
MLVALKTCNKCNSSLPLTLFNKERKNKDGLSYWCKTCSNDYKMNWNKSNPDYMSKYRLVNRIKISEVVKTYKKSWISKNQHIKAWRYVLRGSLKRFDKIKEEKTIQLLGYSAIELKGHIEKQFTEEMSWNNYGEWHIDHIKPIYIFDKNTHPSIVNALSNLRPLWATTKEINGVVYEGNLNRPKSR